MRLPSGHLNKQNAAYATRLQNMEAIFRSRTAKIVNDITNTKTKYLKSYRQEKSTLAQERFMQKIDKHWQKVTDFGKNASHPQKLKHRHADRIALKNIKKDAKFRREFIADWTGDDVVKTPSRKVLQKHASYVNNARIDDSIIKDAIFTHYPSHHDSLDTPKLKQSLEKKESVHFPEIYPRKRSSDKSDPEKYRTHASHVLSHKHSDMDKQFIDFYRRQIESEMFYDRPTYPMLKPHRRSTEHGKKITLKKSAKTQSTKSASLQTRMIYCKLDRVLSTAPLTWWDELVTDRLVWHDFDNKPETTLEEKLSRLNRCQSATLKDEHKVLRIAYKYQLRQSRSAPSVLEINNRQLDLGIQAVNNDSQNKCQMSSEFDIKQTRRKDTKLLSTDELTTTVPAAPPVTGRWKKTAKSLAHGIAIANNLKNQVAARTAIASSLPDRHHVSRDVHSKAHNEKNVTAAAQFLPVIKGPSTSTSVLHKHSNLEKKKSKPSYKSKLPVDKRGSGIVSSDYVKCLTPTKPYASESANQLVFSHECEQKISFIEESVKASLVCVSKPSTPHSDSMFNTDTRLGKDLLNLPKLPSFAEMKESGKFYFPASYQASNEEKRERRGSAPRRLSVIRKANSPRGSHLTTTEKFHLLRQYIHGKKWQAKDRQDQRNLMEMMFYYESAINSEDTFPVKKPLNLPEMEMKLFEEIRESAKSPNISPITLAQQALTTKYLRIPAVLRQSLEDIVYQNSPREPLESVSNNAALM